MAEGKYRVRSTRDVVADMRRDGYSQSETARMLNLTRQTVQYHWTQIDKQKAGKA